MATKNKSLRKYDAPTMACIQSAYEDLQLMVEEIFTKIKTISNQLSFEEFILLFEQYDWQDIIDKLEEYDYLAAQQYYPSLYALLNDSFIADKSIYCIMGGHD